MKAVKILGECSCNINISGIGIVVMVVWTTL